MKIDSSEVTEFINAVKGGIIQSQDKNFELVSNVDFEISVAIHKKGGGTFNIVILDATGKYDKTNVTKIKFSMGNERATDMSINPLIKIISSLDSLDSTK